MSSVVIPISTRLWSGQFEQTVGASAASNRLSRLVEEAENEVAVAARAEITDSLNGLVEVFKDCSKPDWDAHGALPVSSEAVLEALSFIRQLPIGIQAPDVSPEPDGEVGLEWSDGHARSLVISFSGDGRISYAALLGGDRRIHGSERFLGTIPQGIHHTLLQFPRRRA